MSLGNHLPTSLVQCAAIESVVLALSRAADALADADRALQQVKPCGLLKQPRYLQHFGNACIAAAGSAQSRAAQASGIGQAVRGEIDCALVDGIADRVVSRGGNGALQITPGQRKVARPARASRPRRAPASASRRDGFPSTPAAPARPVRGALRTAALRSRRPFLRLPAAGARWWRATGRENCRG